jgi:hypothetical protein
MSGILTPGYLRWDGTKYVLDADIEIVGPPGSAGPAGPVGPVGPVGPGGSGSGDLTGNYPGPMSVVGLTGISGVVSFGSAITNPTITQTATAATNGQFMTLRAQAAALFGGNVVIQSGTGTTAGLIQFLIGSTQVAQFDASKRFLLGPGNASSFNIFGSTPVPTAANFLFSNNATGRNTSGTYVGVANDYASNEVLNYSAGSAATTGIRMIAAGASYATVGSWDSYGVLDQVGSGTSALVFSATSGSTGSTSITGRIFQSGAWGTGDYSLNNNSASAQAGLVGSLINFGPVTGGALTSTPSQAIIFNQFTSGGPTYGLLSLQGHVGIALYSNTTEIASTTTTKWITYKGQTNHVTTTATSPYNVLTTDYIVSLSAFTAVSTTTTGVQTLPVGTINVVSTASFPTSGFILVATSNGPQVVQYTGTSGGNSFTGCTGGTGNTSSGGAVTSLFTVNLPLTPATGDTYIIKDAGGSAGNNNILINGNGVNIDSGVSNIVVMTNFTQAQFTYNGTIWISALSTNIAPNSGYTSVVNVPSGGSALVVGFDQLLLCDPSTAAITITAPATPIVNMRFTVKDATFTSGTHNISVNGNGKTLEDPNTPGSYVSPVVFAANGRSATWAYDPTRTRFTLVSTAL